MRRLLLDTAVLAYAVGGEHGQRRPCRAVLEAAARGEVELHISAEALQELLFHRLRRVTRASAVQQTRDASALCVVHAFDRQVAERMLTVAGESPLGVRDAVHAATALVHGFDAIVTPDTDFDRAPGLCRVEPASALI